MRADDPPKRRKVIRSLSLEEETLRRLHAVANQRKISVNALLQEVIDFYLEIGVHSGDIGLVQIAVPYFRLILDNCDCKHLVEKASRMSAAAWQEWAELRGLKRDLPSFLNMVKYHEPSGWAKIAISKELSGSTKIIFTHNVGENWSRFMAAWFKGGYEYMVGKTLPDSAIKFLSSGFSMTI